MMHRRAFVVGAAAFAPLGRTLGALGEEVRITRNISFTVRFASPVRADLLKRLNDVRWSDAVSQQWDYGTSPAFLRSLIDYWRSRYDFDAAEERLNRFPQFRVQINNFGLHYILLKGKGLAPQPLLLMNGWPSSFVEYGRLAQRLADPATYGGSPADAFDVVMPVLPGFGFSDRPTRPYASCTGDSIAAFQQ